MKKMICVLLSVCSIHMYADEYIQTVYGNCMVTEPVLCELINSKAFKRLKGVNQYGIVHYIHPSVFPYTRYIHSLNVFYLLRAHGATEEEQIAGLLHDASHTVFSHVGDHLIHTPGQVIDQNGDAYQDEKHVWILSQTDVKPILEKYGYTLEQINHKSGRFHMLEADLPDLCADRIEYNIYGSYAEGWLTQDEVQAVARSLHYKEGVWYFDDIKHAEKVAYDSLRLCHDIFSAYFNAVSYHCTARALMRSLEIGEIVQEDILYGQDYDMLARLQESNDMHVQRYVRGALQAKANCSIASKERANFVYIGKFRGVNPWVLVGEKLQRLTDISEQFKQQFNAIKDAVVAKKYYYIRGID